MTRYMTGQAWAKFIYYTTRITEDCKEGEKILLIEHNNVY